MSEWGATLFSVLAIISAIVMLVSKHPMRMALGLVSVMLNLALVYGFLRVHILAVGQVLIYVGAVMVLMIYVIMLLDIRDVSIQRPVNKLIIPTIMCSFLMAGVILCYFIKSSAPSGIFTNQEIFSFTNFEYNLNKS
ncbi:MAG: NADH-quinone oxidoreductase subunit J [Pseudomonadota bacterium]